MSKLNPEVDLYIDKAADFAKPILKHLRNLIHTACPEIVETIKWGCPHFTYKGIVCGMAAFKQHCVFGFSKQALLKDPAGIFKEKDKHSMGQMGKLISLSDLPDDSILINYMLEAIALNDAGIILPKKVPSKAELKIPTDFAKALADATYAKHTFDLFSYSNQKEYIDWIMEAKTQVTRQRRLDISIEWLSEGKPRNWKYMASRKKR